MGYTIYWKTKPKAKITQEEARLIVSRIKNLVEENPTIIKYDFIDSVDEDNINFNGIEEGGHETFCFYTDFSNNKREEYKNDDVVLRGVIKFSFCKTARKPYDRFVKLALMIIQDVTGNKLKISQDGFNEETDPENWANYVSKD